MISVHAELVCTLNMEDLTVGRVYQRTSENDLVGLVIIVNLDWGRPKNKELIDTECKGHTKYRAINMIVLTGTHQGTFNTILLSHFLEFYKPHVEEIPAQVVQELPRVLEHIKRYNEFFPCQ
jgi:hypothetical protein